MQIDLGQKGGQLGEIASPTPKMTYPLLSLRDTAYDAFKKMTGGIEIGDEIELTSVQAMVTGVREDQFGRSVDLEIRSIRGEGVAGEGDEGGGSDDAMEEDEMPETPPKVGRIKSAATAAKAVTEEEE